MFVALVVAADDILDELVVVVALGVVVNYVLLLHFLQFSNRAIFN